MNLSTRAAERTAGQRRPVQGNSPDGRKDYPDFKPSQESLRRSPTRSPRDPGRRSLAVRTTGRAEGPSTWRFSGMAESIGPMWFHNKNRRNLRAGCRLPLVGPRTSVSESDGRSASCSSSSMSSGRLILDRVARQQSPSPLHRHPQNNTHPEQAQAKGDISTLLGRGHSYFALTLQLAKFAGMPPPVYALGGDERSQDMRGAILVRGSSRRLHASAHRGGPIACLDGFGRGSDAAAREREWRF